MAKFSENLKRAADDAERLAKALANGETGAPGGGGGGGGQVNFPTTIVTNVQLYKEPGKTIRTGDGSGTGGKDLQSRAFAYFGLSSANASAAFIAQIVRAFQQMLDKSALSVRTMGGG